MTRLWDGINAKLLSDAMPWLVLMLAAALLIWGGLALVDAWTMEGMGHE
jgi:hypothetical protein